MTPVSADVELAASVQLLLDRAAISDLLIEFARSLDERDWAANTQLYVAEGVFEVAGGFRLEGHDELRRTGSPQGLAQYDGTWHLSANHAIHVEGDTATSRSYLIGLHMLGAGKGHHADGGGWYDCTLRRTPAGWRFVTVRITEVWTAGEPLPHVPPSPTTQHDERE